MTKESLDEKIREALKFSQTDYLSFQEFNKRTGISTRAIRQNYDNWSDACSSNGIRSGPVQEEVSLETLASDFLSVVLKDGKIPSLHRLIRLTKRGEHVFSKKHEGYDNFRHKAIKYLFTAGLVKDANELELLQNVKFRIEPIQTPVCRMAMIFDPDGNTICIHKRNVK